jgi:hypothetical protein
MRKTELEGDEHIRPREEDDRILENPVLIHAARVSVSNCVWRRIQQIASRHVIYLSHAFWTGWHLFTILPLVA